MKLLTLTIMAMMVMGAAVQAEEKTSHYEGKKFETAEAASKALTETSQKMAEFASTEDLDVVAMEEIHEISYTTEEAIAKLKEANKDYNFTQMAERLELVHLASEEHEVGKVRRYFIQYQSALNDYLAQ